MTAPLTRIEALPPAIRVRLDWLEHAIPGDFIRVHLPGQQARVIAVQRLPYFANTAEVA